MDNMKIFTIVWGQYYLHEAIATMSLSRVANPKANLSIIVLGNASVKDQATRDMAYQLGISIEHRTEVQAPDLQGSDCTRLKELIEIDSMALYVDSDVVIMEDIQQVLSRTPEVDLMTFSFGSIPLNFALEWTMHRIYSQWIGKDRSGFLKDTGGTIERINISVIFKRSNRANGFLEEAISRIERFNQETDNRGMGIGETVWTSLVQEHWPGVVALDDFVLSTVFPFSRSGIILTSDGKLLLTTHPKPFVHMLGRIEGVTVESGKIVKR